ncbi:hypothetical protein F5882DRAFT_379778 [Hyaloscypha sp. PMI_1271]|nr:hypothetical protein F5882DRAFT_379778 [Hyaloscypha sp. PMI_1271]
MSLLTLHSSPAPRTPRERVYSRAEQYFDITALGARSTSTQFLPSPITEEPTNNWSAEDQATWDQRLANGGTRYALCYNDAFEILTTTHEKLIHIAFNTIFEHARRIWHGLSRDDHAWISAYCAHCNKEKAQKNSKGVITPI